MKPRNYTQARNMGYIITRVNPGRNQVRVDLKQRFFDPRNPSVVSFYITYTGAKRLGLSIDY